MPQQTVYIRNDDMIKWKALENKAAFISQHLNTQPNIIKKPDSRGTSSPSPEFKGGTNLCKIHNTPLTVFGKCLMKGCKYA